MKGMPARHRDHSLGLVPASVEDYRELARRRLPRQIFDYIDGGSFGEYTLAANRDDLRRIQLRQRVRVTCPSTRSRPPCWARSSRCR